MVNLPNIKKDWILNRYLFMLLGYEQSIGNDPRQNIFAVTKLRGIRDF